MTTKRSEAREGLGIATTPNGAGKRVFESKEIAGDGVIETSIV
jgi:hypothetical protein